MDGRGWFRFRSPRLWEICDKPKARKKTKEEKQTRKSSRGVEALRRWVGKRLAVGGT